MNADERTILLLAAEALRNPSHWLAEHRLLLADATDRIAGAEKPDPLSFTTTLDPRFGPNTTGPLADAPDRIAGAEPVLVPAVETDTGKEVTLRMDPPPSRFTPNSGKCWRCGSASNGINALCHPCAYDAPAHVFGGSLGDYLANVRTWIEAEEKGEKP